jgi:hypothetical protein
MNTERIFKSTLQATTGSGESVAAEYIARELPKARKTLRRTKIICVILILFVGAYMGTITTITLNFLKPKAAAEVVSGMVMQHVEREGPVLAAQAEREIPALIRQTPDYLIKEIPVFRKELQRSIETECETYCLAQSKELGVRVDELLDQHKSEIKTALENANDREAIRKILPDFDTIVLESMNKKVEGKAVNAHIGDWAVALAEIQQRMDRLANGNDLTPEEQKARQALALLARAIQTDTQMSEDNATTTPKVATLQ